MDKTKSPSSTLSAIAAIGAVGLRLRFTRTGNDGRFRHKLGQKTLFHLLTASQGKSEAKAEPLPGYIHRCDEEGFEVVFWRDFVGEPAFAELQELATDQAYGHSHGQGKMVFVTTSYAACHHLVAVDNGIGPLAALALDGQFAAEQVASLRWYQSRSLAITPPLLKEAYGIQADILPLSAEGCEEAMAEELCAEAKQAKGPFYLAGDGTRLASLKKRLVMMGVYEDHIPVETTHNPPPRFKIDKSALKEGLTTGACSTAAAKAATLLATGGSSSLGEVTSKLPMGREQVFKLFRQRPVAGGYAVSIIKNAGDDPDVTHGAEITATVTVTREPGIRLKNGKGVAEVTKPGLGLTVGEPAINPVPRQTITEQVQAVLDASPSYQGATVTISIEDGEDRAKNTTNARLGLLGGLSILGTTGVVKPYSTAAFVASVTQSIKLAGHDGHKAVVFTTGGRSEQFAMKLLPAIAESCFIQVGDYIGVALRNSVAVGMASVYIVAMVGKLSKMADGRMMTHASGSTVNMTLLSELAGRAGASQKAQQEILGANTARHVLDICTAEGMAPQFCTTICAEVKGITERFSKGKVTINVVMVDFVGKVIARYPEGIELATKAKH